MVTQIRRLVRIECLKPLLAVGLFLVATLLFGSHTAYATNPSLISFQGKVVNADGTNVTNGTYNFDFVLYDDPTLGTPSDGVHDKWHELTKSVTVTNGVFQTNLGSATALPDFNANPSLYLAIRFNADAAGYMTPRIQLASVPYALNTDKLGGLSSSSFGQLAANQTWTGTNIFQPTTNINGETVRQTSAASPTADIFDVQGTNGTTNFLQITSTAANQGAVTLQSVGGSNGLTLQSGSGTVSLGSSTALNANGALNISTGGTTQTLSLTTLASTSAATGAITIQSGNATVGSNLNAGTVTIDTGTATGAGTATVSIGAVNAKIIQIGPNATNTTTTTYQIGANAAGAQAIAVGSTGTGATANASTTVSIQGGTAAGAISIGTTAAVNQVLLGSTNGGSSLTERVGTGNYSLDGAATSTYALGASTVGGTIAIGGTAQTGNLTLGSSTAGQSVLIGNGSGAPTVNIANASVSGVTLNLAGAANTSANSINIANGASAAATTVSILSGAGTAGASSLLLANNARVNQIDIGNVAAAAARTINVGTGANTVGIDTLNIGTGATTIAGGKTINIGNGTPTGAGTNLISIGSTANASTTTIQGGTGNVNLVTNNAAAGVIVQSNTDTPTAFQVQTSDTSPIFNVDTTDTNLLAGLDSGFESNPLTSWVGKGTGSVARSTAQEYTGNASGAITTTAAANSGIQLPVTLSTGIQYTFSLYARLSSGAMNTFVIGHQDVSGTDIDCLTGQTLSAVGWTRFTCTFTTGGTVTSPNLYVKQSDAVARSGTIFIDAVQLEAGANASPYGDGNIQTDAVVTSPVSLQNSADSTTAFLVQDASSTPVLSVDTLNNNITLGGNNSATLAGWNNTTTIPANTQGTQVTANGYVYILGGDADAASTTVRYARLNADGTIPASGQPGTWGTTTSMPQAVEFEQAVVLNGYIYTMGGGLASGKTSSVYYSKVNLDGTLGAWTATTSLPPPTGISSGGAATYNGYIYMIGGFTPPSNTVNATVYYAKANADGTVGTWNTTTALPGVREGTGVAVANGYLYVVGGYNGAVMEPTIYYAKLNPDGTIPPSGTGTWVSNANQPVIGPGEGTAATVLNGYLYVVGGHDVGGAKTAATGYAPLNADGSVGVWSSGPSLGAVEGPNNVFSVNGYIYVLGGEGSVGLNTAQYTTTPRIKLGGSLDLVGLGGENMSDGDSGGTLTAGNTTVVGTLQVQDQATFVRGLSVGGSLAVQGPAVFETSTNSTVALQVENAAGNNVINVDTTGGNQNNLITNGSIESLTNIGNAGDWQARSGSETTFAQDTTQQFIGDASLKVTTSATAGDGAKQNVSLTNGTTYTVSFDAKLDSASAATGFATMQVGYAYNGSDITTLVSPSYTVISDGWTRYSYTFKQNQTNSGTPYIFIKQTDATVRTFYIDAVTVQTDANADSNYREGKIQLGGTITSPVLLQNTTDSTTAFQVQDTTGSPLLNVDSTDANLVDNGDFETSDAGWALKGAATSLIRDSSQQKYGVSSLKVVTTTASGDGVSYTLANSLSTSQQYSFSFSVKAIGANFTNTVAAGYTVTGTDTNCTLTPTSVPTTAGWTAYSCTFTPSGAATSIYIKQSGVEGAGRTFNLDGVDLSPTSGGAVNPFAPGSLSIEAVLRTPLVLQNESDSTNALTLQSASGNMLFSADTLNSTLNLGAVGSSAFASNINIANSSAAAQTVIVGSTNSTSATTIQSGTGNINLATNSASAGVIDKTNTNSATALQVQNSSGNSVFNVNTAGGNQNNLITNPSFEGNSTTGWTGDGGTPCSLLAVTSGTTVPVNGSYSGQCAATAAGQGFKYVTGALTASTIYTLDFYARASATQGTVLNFGHVENGGAEDAAGLSLTSQNILTNGWTHYSLTFKTGATLASGDYIYIKQNDATTRSLWLDGVTLQTDPNADTNYREGTVQLSGPITSSLILQNAVNSTTAFQVENSSGASVLTVDTTDTNLMSNPGAEVNTVGWAVKQASAGASVIRDTSQPKFGAASFKVVTSATAGDGASATISPTLPTGTYQLAFSMKLSSGTFTTLLVGYNNGSDSNACTPSPALSSTVPSTSGWTRFSCSMSVTGPMGSIYFKQSDATARTFWIDGVELDAGNTLTPYGIGNLYFNGVVKTPLTLQNQSDSTSALTLQNVAGNTILSVDTLNSQITVAGAAPASVSGVAGTTPLNTLVVTGATGGANTSGAFTGGAGAGLSLTSGAGGASASTAANSNGGAITIQGGAAGTGGSGAAGAIGAVSVNASGGTVTIGTGGSTAAASTIHIADTTGAANQAVTIGSGISAVGNTSVVTIGSTNANTGSVTTIQGGSSTTGAIVLTPNTAGAILIGAAAGTGNITLGSSSTTQTTIIGGGGGVSTVQIAGGSAANVVTIANVQTTGSVSIGAAMTTGTIAIGGAQTSGTLNIAAAGTRTGNIVIGSAATTSGVLTLNGGTGTGAFGTGTSGIAIVPGVAGTINIGASAGAGTGAITLGQSTATQIVNIANGITGAGNTKTVNIGTAQNASTGVTAINIGLNNTSTGVNTVTIKAGGSGRSQGPSVTLGNVATQSNAVCSSLANNTAPTAGTAYELEDCNVAPAIDYAEMYPTDGTSTYGDIMMLGTQSVQEYDTDGQGNILYNAPKRTVTKLVKATQAYDQNVIGVVSNNYDDFTSTGLGIVDDADNPMPIALNGRIPVNISPNSNPIAAGDYITTSTDPGKGMKATQAGEVIGKALEAWNPNSGQTQIMVFVEQGYYPGPNASSTIQDGGDASLANLSVNGNTTLANLSVIGNTDLSSLNVSGSATITSLTVSGDTNIEGKLVVAGDVTVGGSLTVTGLTNVADLVVNGHIITAGGQPTPQAQPAAGTQATVTIDGTDSIGTITITTGSNPAPGSIADILFSKAYGATPHVVLSPSNSPASALRFFKGTTTANDFMLNVTSTPAPHTTYQYDYFIAQ